jgi:lipopolysaccharide export system permease protein
MLPFLIGTVALVLIFQANTLIAVMKDFNTSNIPNLAIFQLIWYKTPEFMKMTLPAGMALATSLAVTRIVRESELTAMRAAGIPIRRLFLPIIVFSLGIGLLNFFLIERIQPEAEKRAKEVLRKALILGTMPDFQSNVMFKVGARGMVYFATLQRQPNGTAVVSDALYIEQQGNNVVVLTKASKAIYDRGYWTLPDATQYTFREKDLIHSEVKKAVINERVNLEDLMGALNQPREQSLQELQANINRMKELGSDVRMLEVDLHTRFSLPAACVVFALAGPVLAVWFGRSGGFVGIFLSIMLVMLYYNMFVISNEVFGRNGWFPPMLAAWFPNLVILAIALVAMRRLE